MDGTTSITSASGERLEKAQINVNVCNPTRVEIKQSTKLLRDNPIDVPEPQNDSFLAVSESSILEKGILIHIVEDPNVARQINDEQSAVLINVPTEANTLIDDVRIK